MMAVALGHVVEQGRGVKKGDPMHLPGWLRFCAEGRDGEHQPCHDLPPVCMTRKGHSEE